MRAVHKVEHLSIHAFVSTKVYRPFPPSPNAAEEFRPAIRMVTASAKISSAPSANRRPVHTSCLYHGADKQDEPFFSCCGERGKRFGLENQ
jgi:hypothetical protein